MDELVKKLTTGAAALSKLGYHDKAAQLSDTAAGMLEAATVWAAQQYKFELDLADAAIADYLQLPLAEDQEPPTTAKYYQPLTADRVAADRHAIDKYMASRRA